MSSWDPDYWLKELANPNFLAVDFNPGEHKAELKKEKNENTSSFLLDLNDPPEGVTKATMAPFQFNFVGTDKKPIKEETFGVEKDVDKEAMNEVIIDFASLLSTETKNEKVKHINITCTLTDLVSGGSSDIIQAVLESLRNEKEARQQSDSTEPLLVSLDEEYKEGRKKEENESNEFTISFSELIEQQEKDKPIKPDIFMNFVREAKEKNEDNDEKHEVDETKSVISFSDLAEEEEKKKEKKKLSFNLDAPEFVPPPKKPLGIYRNGLFIPTQQF